MAKPNFTLPNKPAIKSGSILSYNYTDDFTFVPAPLTFNRDSAATRVNEKGLIEDVGYFGPELIQNGDFSEIGPELITNGGFDTDSDWTKETGWSIEDGVANFNDTIASADAVLRQDNLTLTNGNTYKLSFNVNNTSGTGQIKFLATGGGTDNIEGYEVYSGVNTLYFTPTADRTTLKISGRDTYGSFTIDNVSVKEVGQNWETEGSSSLELADFQGRSNVANINILNTITSSRIRQSFDYVNGKRYKVSVDVYLVSGNFRIDCSDTFVSGDFVSTSTTGSWITLETEIQAISTGSNYIWLRSSNTVSQFYVSNVSVIEILGDKPRIDYSDSLTEPSLLLEPQSTNLVTESEDFSEWSLGVNATLSYVSDVVAPDGSFGVYRLQLPATGATYIASNSFTGQNPLALSIYAKSVNTNNDFNLYDGSISSPIKTATNEWQRFDYIGNGNQFYIINSGDTFVTDIYIWGAQAEALPYATSYIPTAGSTATRLGETAKNAGDVNVFNSEEGVLYAEIAALANDETNREITLSDGTTNNYVLIRFNSGGSNRIYTRVDVNTSVEYFELNTSYNITDNNKIAIRFKNSDFATFINGTKVDFQLSGNSFPSNTLNKINFDNGGGFNKFHGKVKNVQVFNKALTDRELEILTIQ